MASSKTPPVSGAAEWDTTLNIQVTITFADGNRRVHAPHFTEIREKVESYIEALLTGRSDKPYAIEKIASSAYYGYSFDV